MCARAWLFKVQEKRDPSLWGAITLLLRLGEHQRSTSPSPWSVTSDLSTLPAQLPHQMVMCPAGIRRAGVCGKTIHGHLLEIPLLCMWSEEETIQASTERKRRGRKEWFACIFSLTYSNLGMAETDSRVFSGPCLVAQLTSGAKYGVTGRALGQQNKPESSDVESAQHNREMLGKSAARNCRLYGTTDYSGYLPPTKALNMQYKPTHKQTNKQTHTIHINTQTPEGSWRTPARGEHHSETH